MTVNTDTPITDAQLERDAYWNNSTGEDLTRLARRLERDLAAANARLDTLEINLANALSDRSDLIAALDLLSSLVIDDNEIEGVESSTDTIKTAKDARAALARAGGVK